MRDPRRRNRNIGTAKAGRGADNRAVIPNRLSDMRMFWERLASFVAVPDKLPGQGLTFVVEPPRAGFLHHCTIQDVVKILKMLPPEDVRPIAIVVFRQPTAKQRALQMAWGRLAYWCGIGKYEGPGIFLEAQAPDSVFQRGKSLPPDEAAELGRLREDGHQIHPHRRGFRIRSTSEAIRATQLYRTLPHEIGHSVDYLQCRRKLPWGGDELRFHDLYDAKPAREKEIFAHRYADQFRRAMQSRGELPFPPQFDAEEIRKDGLKPEWFARFHDLGGT